MPRITEATQMGKNNKPRVREATQSDIPRLVDIDLMCFDDVYGDTPPPRAEVGDMLTDRLKAAGKLMIVGSIDNQVEGFMTCQITDKRPGDFVDWDTTTDKGHITGTHNPEGDSFYIVNMTVTPQGSDSNLGDMLIANMYGRFIEHRKDTAQLLSRIPQFTRWLQESNIDFDALSDVEQDELADAYTREKKVNDKGREVLYDGMLRRYGYAGAKPVKVVRDGFKDPASQDYGVLCVVDNPLPKVIRHNKVASAVIGRTLRSVSQRPSIVGRIF